MEESLSVGNKQVGAAERSDGQEVQTDVLRPYYKNDQARMEEKNTLVSEFFGYER